MHVTVVGTTPLPGVEQPVDQVPAPVQTSTAADLDRSGALDLSEFMGRRLQGVHINEMQGNPFQPDVNYRGYTASPLLGTPQGLSVYMDGVRLNQPFGDVVSWDLIPRMAIASTALMPGSNPLFGLNTLGGALAVTTKSGCRSGAPRCRPTTAATRAAASTSSTAACAAGRSTGTWRARCSRRTAGATTRRPMCGRSSASSDGSGRAGPPR
jgi:outer membrane cobalamin receptor